MMQLIKKHCLLQGLVVFVAVLGMSAIVFGGKAHAAISWPCNDSGPKTIYGFSPGNDSNIDFGTVSSGTSVSRTISGQVHVCSNASYTTAGNAAIDPYDDSRYSFSPGRIVYGDVARGNTAYDNFGVTLNTSGLSPGTYQFCFGFAGAATYGGSRPVATGSACGVVTISAPPSDGELVLIKKIKTGSGYVVGDPGGSPRIGYKLNTASGYNTTTATTWYNTVNAGVYDTSANTGMLTGGWTFNHMEAMYEPACAPHSGTESWNTNTNAVRICESHVVYVTFFFDPPEPPPGATIVLRRQVEGAGTLTDGTPPTTCWTNATYGYACQDKNSWSAAVPFAGTGDPKNLFNTKTQAIPSDWIYVGNDVSYSKACESHPDASDGTRTTSTDRLVRVCADLTVTVTFIYKKVPPKGGITLYTDVPNGSGGWVVGNVPGNASSPAGPNTCATFPGGGWSCAAGSSHAILNLDPGAGYYAYTTPSETDWDYRGFTVTYNPGCNGHPSTADLGPHPAPAGDGTNRYELRVCSGETVEVHFRFVPRPVPFNITVYPGAASDDEENPAYFHFDASVESNRSMVLGSGINVNRSYYRIRGGVQASLGGNDSSLEKNFVGNVPVTMSQRAFNQPFSIGPVLPGDQYCTTVVATPGSGTYDGVGGITGPGVAVQDSRCVTIANKPYVSFYGNDVSAGAGFTSTCVGAPGTAKIDANFKTSNGVGAGVQFAAFAMNQITGFASATERTATPVLPSGLTFANDPPATPPAFGGDFTGTPHCLPDYYGGHPSTVTTGPLTVTNGVQYFTGNQTIGGATIAEGQHTTLYVDGDVTITGNIVFGSGPRSTPNSIPTFDLIVQGNINIANNVTNLDGWYIAQPKAANVGGTGTITTCTKPDGSKYNSANGNINGELFANCANQLVINGSFTAKKVNFFRTKYSLRDGASHESAASSKAAEVFRFSPETYLAKHALPTTDTTGGSSTDYFTSLPPIL